MQHSPYATDDFGRHPLMFYYEVTQACDLVCKHCRASAQEKPAEDELSTEQSLALIDEVARFERKPTMVFTGGDPLKRADLFRLISHASERGIQTALTPSATPLATREAFEKAKQAGVQALGISLDGPNAVVHDAFRGFEGSFRKTMEMLDMARELGFPVQVNTSLTRRNFDLLDAIADLLEDKKIMMWSVFFLVPVGRGLEEERIRPEEYEIAFAKLWHHALTKPFAVKTTEAPHYRRYVLQQGGHPLQPPCSNGKNTENKQNSIEVSRVETETDHQIRGHEEGETNHRPDRLRSRTHRAPLGVTDGRGIMFVSNNGEIYPAGFLPVLCGRFPADSPVEVYKTHPIFKQLQDPNNYHGICGACEYRLICGGSRARAYAVTGDWLGPEPDCVYQVGQRELYIGADLKNGQPQPGEGKEAAELEPK